MGLSEKFLRTTPEGVVQRYCKPGAHWLDWDAVNFYPHAETHENLSRVCRACTRRRSHAWYLKQRAAAKRSPGDDNSPEGS